MTVYFSWHNYLNRFSVVFLFCFRFFFFSNGLDFSRLIQRVLMFVSVDCPSDDPENIIGRLSSCRSCALHKGLLWGLPFKLDTSSICVLLRHLLTGGSRMSGGGDASSQFTQSLLLGQVLWPGRENCFITLWKHDRRQNLKKGIK